MMVQPIYLGIGFSLLTFACGDDSTTKDGSSSGGSSGSSGSSGASSNGDASATGSSGTGSGSATSLEAWCDAQAAPACPKTPANYAASCKQIFQGQRAKVKAECIAKFDAVMECGATKQTYTCNASGTFQGSPVGACANEGAACDACNGASCTLAGLLGP